MKTACLMLMLAAMALVPSSSARGESIDGRVVQVYLPPGDVRLAYLETKGGMAIRLSTDRAEVIGTRFFIGDGQVAVELVAHPLNGIYLQGDTKLPSGYVFKERSVVEVRPGYKRASELGPGDVYLTLPLVTFKVPAN